MRIVVGIHDTSIDDNLNPNMNSFSMAIIPKLDPRIFRKLIGVCKFNELGEAIQPCSIP